VPLFYITGISGSGKSTALSELQRRGFEAYDVDEAGPATAKWHHNTTGYVHPKSSVKAADRTPEFMASHSWKVPREEVVHLSRMAGANNIFLGGSIANEPELQDLFAAILALAIDDDTPIRRLAARTNNDWGKSPHELEYTLRINQELAERYRKAGYEVIDARQPTDVIVDRILEHVNGWGSR
jgi:predicted ATPase